MNPSVILALVTLIAPLAAALISVVIPPIRHRGTPAAILTILPAVQFSGMFVPTSSLTGGAWVASQIFPSTYFQAISVGIDAASRSTIAGAGLNQSRL